MKIGAHKFRNAVRFLKPTWIAPKITVTVDPVGGDDANDGVTAPLATLGRASEFDFGHYSGRIYLRNTGTHYLPLIKSDYSDPNQVGIDLPVFGSPHNSIEIEGEPTVHDSFVVLSRNEWILTKDNSTPDWTPGEHVGKFIRTNPWTGFYPYFFIQLPIIANTATEIELSGEYGALGAGDAVDIVTNPVVTINPEETNPYGTPLTPAGSLRLRFLDFDGQATQYWAISNNNYNSNFGKPPCRLNMEGCKIYDTYYRGASVSGAAYFFGCWFQDFPETAIHLSNGIAAVWACHFEDVGNAVTLGTGGSMYCDYGASAKNVSNALFNVGEGTLEIDNPLGNNFLRLDNVNEMVRLNNRGYFKMSDQLVFRAGYDSVNNYGIRLDGPECLAELYDTGNSPLSAGTSYFRIGSTNLSASDYVNLYGTRVAFPDENRVRDI